MPVTAKLSQEFYRRLGDAATNELVDWFNKVDATYRADLQQLNELNFTRFDAKLEQRLAQMDAKWEGHLAQMDTKWERRLAELDAKWERRLATIETGWERRISGLETIVERGLKEHTRWMFLAWASLLIPIIGLWMRG